jgi:hypothetical protein
VFDGSTQSSSSDCLTAILPIFPLALVSGALIIAESLACALHFEESPTMSIGANADIARV